jgi:hypothetical protein
MNEMEKYYKPIRVMSKNRLKTAGYFIKRLKDNGFIIIKMFAFYAKDDPRRWTVLVNPGGQSVFITCYENRDANDVFNFEINDGGRYIPKNFSIVTDSIEVIIEYLLSKGVTNREYYPGKRLFEKQRPTNLNEETPQELTQS